MLRSDAVGPFQSLFAGTSDQHCAILLERFGSYRIVHCLLLDFFRDKLSQLSHRSNKEGDSLRIMLSLRDHIAGNEARLAFVAQNNCFRRSGEKVNRAIKRDLLFRRRDIQISRSYDLRHFRHRLSSVSQCSHSVSTADTIELAHTQKLRCGQRLLCWTRRDHADLLYSRHLRGYDSHQNGGRQGIASPRYIASDRLQRTNDLPYFHSGQNRSPPLLRLLGFAILPDIVRSSLYCISKFCRNTGPCFFHFLLRNAQRLFGKKAVPFLRVATHTAVTALADIVHNPPHWLFHPRQSCMTPLLQLTHRALRALAFQNPHQSTTLFSGYSTLPSAFAILSCAMILHALLSSIMLLTAPHSPALTGDIVTSLIATNPARTSGRSCLRTFSISPTRPWAWIAPQSISARFSILRRFSGTVHAVLFAMS